MITPLMEIMKPPMHPMRGTGEKSWGDIESDLGTTLPSGYKEFIYNYGVGVAAGEFMIASPFVVENNIYNLLRQIDVEMKWLKDELNWDIPFFPEEGGLLWFGSTINGGSLFWKTDEEPNLWTVTLAVPRSLVLENFAYTLTDFLLRYILGKVFGESRYYQNILPDVDRRKFDPLVET